MSAGDFSAGWVARARLSVVIRDFDRIEDVAPLRHRNFKAIPAPAF